MCLDGFGALLTVNTQGLGIGCRGSHLEESQYTEYGIEPNSFDFARKNLSKGIRIGGGGLMSPELLYIPREISYGSHNCCD